MSFIDEQKILTVFSWNSILTKDRQCSQCLLMVSCRLYYAFPKLFAVAAKDVVMQRRADDALYCHYIIQTSNFKKNSSLLLKHKSIIFCYNIMKASWWVTRVGKSRLNLWLNFFGNLTINCKLQKNWLCKDKLILVDFHQFSKTCWYFSAVCSQ